MVSLSPDPLPLTPLPGTLLLETVGTWQMNGEELHLFVNMDERQFRTERMRQGRGTLGANYAERLADRHVAHLAFHLYQLHDQSQRQVERSNREREVTDDTGNDTTEYEAGFEPDSPVVAYELRRVAATLVQSLKSESELIRLEADVVSQQ